VCERERVRKRETETECVSQAMIELRVLPTCLDLFFKVSPTPYKRERVCV
jgi:hypothetical protein